jgi:hypothetical protein
MVKIIPELTVGAKPYRRAKDDIVLPCLPERKNCCDNTGKHDYACVNHLKIQKIGLVSAKP